MLLDVSGRTEMRKCVELVNKAKRNPQCNRHKIIWMTFKQTILKICFNLCCDEDACEEAFVW